MLLPHDFIAFASLTLRTKTQKYANLHDIAFMLNVFTQMPLQYFVEAGTIAVRRVRKEDLRHVAKATGATAVFVDSFCCNDANFDYLIAPIINS